MVPSRGERPNSPSHPPPQPDHDHHVPVALVLGQLSRVVGRDRDGDAVEEGRPHVDVIGILVGRRDAGAERDLLVLVGGVDVQAVVVDGDVVVGVVGGDGDLEGGGEEARGGGGVEGVDGGVLEGEAGLVGLEDGPCYEHYEQDYEGHHQADLEHSQPYLPPLVAAVVRALRHDEDEDGGLGGVSGVGGGVVVDGVGKWSSMAGDLGTRMDTTYI